MATLSHSDSRRRYSWWWDSHISPKNSKWLQENLTDMDVKVKAMIKLIEEDADSFARRAEMYYKKRPELMKLVEEFYRAYRALAERYDHATGELRQAHRTMAEAFPNQVPYVLADDSPSVSTTPGPEPHTPEMPHPIRALIKKGLSVQIEEQAHSLQGGLSQLSSENRTLKLQVLSESEPRSERADGKVEALRQALAKLTEEKEASVLKYEQCLEKIAKLEGEIKRAQEDAKRLNFEILMGAAKLKSAEEQRVQLETSNQSLQLEADKLVQKIAMKDQELSKRHEELEKLQIHMQDEHLRFVQVEATLQNLQNLHSQSQEEQKALALELETGLQSLRHFRSPVSFFREKNPLSLLRKPPCLQIWKKTMLAYKRRKHPHFAKPDWHLWKTIFITCRKKILVLQKFIQDMEEKNYSLLIECQKHIEASRLSEKLISELETENLEQQVEAEFLLDEIEKLRRGICQVFKALQINLDNVQEEKIEQEQILLRHIIGNMEDMKSSLLKSEDEKQQLEVENSVLLTVLQQLRMNRQLGLEVSKRDHLEGENSAILHETVALSNLSLVLNNFWSEKVGELKALAEDFDNLHGVNSDLGGEVGILTEKLGLKETENLHLKGLVEKLDKELHEVTNLSDQLNNQLSVGKDLLSQKQKDLSEAKQKLKAAQDLTAELFGTMNGNLESELDMLHEEIEEYRIRGEKLNSELHERSNDFELWEAEATTFYFDLQVSSVREVLFENKVHELTGVCENLEDESASKSIKIQQMRERVSFLESEIGGLKAQLSAYGPIIVSLRDNIASLEHNALFRSKLQVADNQKPKDMEMVVHEKSSQELREDQGTPIPDGISDLQEIQTRIKAVEKAVIEEAKPEISKVRHGILMKDIPLDQVSDCSLYGKSRRDGVTHYHFEDVKQKSARPSSELQVEKELGIDRLEVSTSSMQPNQDGNKRKILERLASDAEKLMSLQIVVQDLQRKMATTKKSKRAKSLEYGTLKEQLQEVEEAVAQLVDINCQLTRNMDESASSSDGMASPELQEAGNVQRKKVTEQARRGSEKIGRLQLEVQKIQYVLLKLDDEKKSSRKYRFLAGRTSILLKDFIYTGRRRTERRKKACGCWRPYNNVD
ncbi:unnamed protein product, partial [Vitis vinifera]